MHVHLNLLTIGNMMMEKKTIFCVQGWMILITKILLLNCRKAMPTSLSLACVKLYG